MGTVYAARQTSVDRPVALKVLRPELADDAQAVRRFMQEARALSALWHPNTVSIYDFGETEAGLLFLAMELVVGRTLSELVVEGGLPAGRACGLVAQILHALHEAHGAGIIHRDLKPDNVLVASSLGHEYLKVLDFGLARIVDEGHSALTQPGQVFGTPAYMSPEQAQGNAADHRADLYAVGCIFYELLAGRRLFISPQPLAVLVQHLRESPPRFEALDSPGGAG